jgi:hypothetical protein
MAARSISAQISGDSFIASVAFNAFIALRLTGFEEIEGGILCDEGRKRKIPVMVVAGLQCLAKLDLV